MFDLIWYMTWKWDLRDVTPQNHNCVEGLGMLVRGLLRATVCDFAGNHKSKSEKLRRMPRLMSFQG